MLAALIFSIYWFILPPLSLFYVESFILFQLLGLVVISLIVWVKVSSIHELKLKILNAKSLKVVIAVVVINAASWLLSWIPLVHWQTRYTQLSNGNEAIEEVEYQEMIESVDTSQLPVMDEETAKILAEGKLGGDATLGSVFEIGDGAKIDVGGTIYWIFQLNHSGFFAWWSHKVSPGFISVNASNASDVEFHKGYNILYSPSSYWVFDTMRHVRRQNPTEGLTEYTFEVDDNWEPFEVITTYKNLTGLLTHEATGVIINNPQTGEETKYSIMDVPEWVDIVQPESFIEDQINNYGKYVHGIYNPGHRDEKEKTPQMLTVYKDNDCYYFTGITSVGKDEALNGFMLVNSRTKKVFRVRAEGITEKRAMEKAIDSWSNYGYYAIEPLPINIDGVATYAIPVKSESSNVITGYTLVCINDVNIYAIGDSLKDAAKQYSKRLASVGVYAASDKAYKYELTSVEIYRISSEVQDGDTFYSFVILGDRTKIFTCGYSISNELAVTKEGDKVSFTYVDDGNGSFSVTLFDNLLVSTVVSENQQQRNEGDSSANSDIDILNVNPEENESWWENLTEEEKAEIMNKASSENN